MQKDPQLIGLFGILMQPENRPNYHVAAACGIPPTRLSEYARGRREIPPVVLLRLCDICDVTPEEILAPYTPITLGAS